MTPPIFPRITPLHRPSWTHQSCGSKDWVITKVTVTSRLTTSRRGKNHIQQMRCLDPWWSFTLLYTGCYSLLNIRLQLHGQWYAKCGYAKSDCTPKTWYKTRSLLLGFVWFTTMYIYINVYICLILWIVLITIKFEIPTNLPEHHTARDHHWQRAWGEVQKPTISRNFSNRHQNVRAQNPSKSPWSHGKWCNYSGSLYETFTSSTVPQIDENMND